MEHYEAIEVAAGLDFCLPTCNCGKLYYCPSLPSGDIGCVHVGSPKCGVRLTEKNNVPDVDRVSQIGDFTVTKGQMKSSSSTRKGGVYALRLLMH